MRKTHLLIVGAWLVHAVAWFVPVVKEGVALPHGLPGWQAFRVASCAVWPYEGMGVDGWYNVALSTMSAATTLLFVLGSVWIVWAGTRAVLRVSAWTAASAFIVNAHWFLRFGSDRLGLRIGYFLWWFSFLLLAIGLFQLHAALTIACNCGYQATSQACAGLFDDFESDARRSRLKTLVAQAVAWPIL